MIEELVEHKYSEKPKTEEFAYVVCLAIPWNTVFTM